MAAEELRNVKLDNIKVVNTSHTLVDSLIKTEMKSRNQKADEQWKGSYQGTRKGPEWEEDVMETKARVYMYTMVFPIIVVKITNGGGSGVLTHSMCGVRGEDDGYSEAQPRQTSGL